MPLPLRHAESARVPGAPGLLPAAPPAVRAAGRAGHDRLDRRIPGGRRLLVVIGEAVFPSTKGFAHFQFSDYAKLTVVGVIIACVAWPIVTRISSAPRWLFFRLAILVTLVLWLPDLYILHLGESAKAVAVLMVMHLAIAVVTYNLLVHIAPVRPASRVSADGRPPAGVQRRVSGQGVSGQTAGDPAARGATPPGPPPARSLTGSSGHTSPADQNCWPPGDPQPRPPRNPAVIGGVPVNHFVPPAAHSFLRSTLPGSSRRRATPENARSGVRPAGRQRKCRPVRVRPEIAGPGGYPVAGAERRCNGLPPATLGPHGEPRAPPRTGGSRWAHSGQQAARRPCASFWTSASRCSTGPGAPCSRAPGSPRPTTAGAAAVTTRRT